MEGSAPPTEVAASPVELPAPPAGVISIEVEGAGDGVTVAPMTADDEAMMADFFKEVDNAKRDGEVMRYNHFHSKSLRLALFGVDGHGTVVAGTTYGHILHKAHPTGVCIPPFLERPSERS